MSSFPTAEVSPKPLELSELIALAELVETKIGHEVALMGHRMEWLVVAEAFLFGAFATILSSGSAIQPTPRRIMLFLLPSLGMAMVGFALISLQAALKVSRALLEARGVIDLKLLDATGIRELPNLGTKTRTASLGWTERGGRLTVQCIPPLILIAWTTIVLTVVLMPRP